MNERLKINKEIVVHDFVSDFLGISRGLKVSKADILRKICRDIKKNRDFLISINIHIDIPKNHFIVAKSSVERFFKNCLLIKDLRKPTLGEMWLERKKGIKKIFKPSILPETMDFKEIMFYIKYCERNEEGDNIIYILNKEDLKNQKKFIDTIRDELFAAIYSIENISYWIHLGDGVNLENFS